MSTSPVHIFEYRDYRQFLKDFLEQEIVQQGTSYRYYARTCGLSSPNYFQQIISRKKNVSQAMAKRISVGLGFSRDEGDYFLQLVALATAASHEQDMILGRMKAIMLRHRRQPILDVSIHSHWLHAVLWEMSHIEDVDLSPETVHSSLRGAATKTEICESLTFLLKKGVIKRVPGKPHRYRPREVVFAPSNDVRRIELQQFHMRMLDFAKHKLNDDFANREIQGLTVAIPVERMDELRYRIRNFVEKLNEEFSYDPDADAVVHVHCGAFKLTS